MKLHRLLRSTLVVGCFFLASTLGAQTYKVQLETGKRLFREGHYGEALLAFEDAVRGRAAFFDRASQTYVELLSLTEVRRLGDSLDAVESFIRERDLAAAQSALDALYELVPRESLRSSASFALSRMKESRGYPEGEYWIGEVYRVEGETALALDRYRKAFSLRSLLEIPAEVDLIRYRMAELFGDRGEYGDMEETLLAILEGDQLWTAGSNDFARNAMLRAIAADGVDRFLTLYRHASPDTYRAHRMLGLYYYRTGRHDRATNHLLFAFLIGATVVLEELKAVDHEFSFVNFPAALETAYKREGALRYMRDTEFPQTIYYLGAALYANGYRRAASELWRSIAGRKEAGQWAGRAEVQLRAPYIEPPTERP